MISIQTTVSRYPDDHGEVESRGSPNSSKPENDVKGAGIEVKGADVKQRARIAQ